ncbi:MAG: exodeoxyribonuclease VII small subunit [Phycisphaerales bacterium]|nr:MAG: exodeoxyribonuclease VII small subunit [Phycisphaerales bacterium]
MARKTQPKRTAPQEMTFEQATEELESIIDKIESGEIGLEDALAERKRGDELIRRCRAILDTAEQELEQIELADESIEGEGEDEEGDA